MLKQKRRGHCGLQYSHIEQGVLFASRAAALLGRAPRTRYLDSTALVGFTAGFLMLLGSGSARAQSLWGGSGSTTTTADYNTSSNWSNPPGVAPVSPGTSALFASFGEAAVNVSASVDPDSWTFATNAQSYAITGSQVTFNTSAGLIDNANAGQSITIGNLISGNAQLVVNGNSTLTLTANNYYTGPTTISSGTLQIGNGSQGSIYFNATVVGNVIDNGVLALNSQDATSLNATVSGNGQIWQLGGKTQFYGGSYTGATIVSGGTLEVGPGSITQSASLTNSATFSVYSYGNSAANFTGTVTNTGLIFNGGTFSAQTIINNSGGRVISPGDVSATTIVNNSGATFLSGGALTLSNPLINAGAFSAYGSLNAPAVNNSGSFYVSGDLTANGSAFNNLTGGTLYLDVDTSLTGLGVLTNAGTVLLTKPGEIFGPENLSATTFINNAGATLTSVAVLTTTGGLINNGVVNADDGSIDGPIINNGTFNVSEAYTAHFKVTSDSTFNNANGATLAVGEGMSQTVSGLLTNSGTLTTASRSSLTDMAGIINTSTGTITNNGAITDILTNAGTVTNNGAYNADVSNTGAITNAGAWTTLASGFANKAGGTLTTTGTLNVTAGGLSNSGIVNASGVIAGAVTNNAGGTFTMNGNVAGVTTFNNAGAVNTNAPLPINATLGAAAFVNKAGGVVTLQNGTIGDRLTLTGTYAGMAGSTIALDVNNTTSGAIGGDQIVIKGASTSGTSSVALAETGVLANKTFFATPILLIKGAPGATFTLATDSETQATVAPIGLISYSLDATQPGQWSLVSSLKTPATGTAAASQVASLISGLNTSFFQATSGFISEPSHPAPNQLSGGPWIRFANGDDTITSQSSSSVTPGLQAAKVETSFAGYQVGIDGGIFNINNSGMNVHLGVTAGQAFATSTDKDAAAVGAVSKGSSEIPFVGVYGAITGNNFFADVMWRTDFFHMNLTDITAPSLGGVTLLNGASEKATAQTLTGDIGYHFAIGPAWFLEPSTAIYVSSAGVDDVAFLNRGGSIAFNNIDSTLARVGARVGTNFVAGNLALQPFVTANLWDELAGPNVATYQLASSSALIQTSRIGTFGQFGLGTSGQLIGSNVLGYIRADVRTGANINGWDLTGGVKYQF